MRQSATASAGATMAAISGPDVDTAAMPTAISIASVRGGRPTVRGSAAAGWVTRAIIGTAWLLATSRPTRDVPTA